MLVLRPGVAMHNSPLLFCRYAACLGWLLVTCATASAQTERPADSSDSCSARLAEAQSRYIAHDYAAVEALVLECVQHSGATQADQVAGYRLLALAFVRQDLLHEAQMAVLKLLGADYGYLPDAVQDPPFYVALVTSIKNQLRVAPPATVTAAPAVAAAAPAARVNVNTATAAELETVPGIGPVMAQRIIALRTQQGPFESVADLRRVQGIGARTLERIAPHLTTALGSWTLQAAGGVTAGDASAPPPTGSAPEAMPAAVRVNVNTASQGELEQLNGIGPALAGRIIAHRESMGPFRRVEDLLEVRGIGPRTLERLAPFVTVEAGSDR